MRDHRIELSIAIRPVYKRVKLRDQVNLMMAFLYFEVRRISGVLHLDALEYSLEIVF